MYIENYLTTLQELILDAILHRKIRKSQYQNAVYLYWCLQNFHLKEPDESIRVDFKGSKKSLESDVLTLDVDGLSFSSEGNHFSENGHDSYSNEYGEIRRGDYDHRDRNQITRRCDGWFYEIIATLADNNPFIDIEYYGEFKRDIDYKADDLEDDDFNEYETSSDFIDSIEEFEDETATWVFKYGNENALRFLLGKKGVNPLFVIGLNPSTADHLKLDPTAQSINQVALNSGFDSWIILNLYPLRSTDPYELPDSMDSQIHQQNLNSIREIIQTTGNPVIWAAWGNGIEIRSYMLQCLRDIYRISSDYNCSWLSFGDITQKGHPRHPLYLNSETEPKLFEIEEYLFG
jgi:hypothetical protein